MNKFKAKNNIFVYVLCDIIFDMITYFHDTTIAKSDKIYHSIFVFRQIQIKLTAAIFECVPPGKMLIVSR